MQTAEEPLRRSGRLGTEKCMRALAWSSETLRFSTPAASRSPARSSEEDPDYGTPQSILNTDRPTKRR